MGRNGTPRRGTLTRAAGAYDCPVPLKILVALDGSEACASLLPHVARLVRASAGQAVLLRVFDPRADVHLRRHEDRDEPLETVSRRMVNDLEAAARAAGLDAATLVSRLSPGQPIAEAIVRASTEAGADVIALGTRGAGSALRHAAFGSVALGVLRQAPMPLLLGGPLLEPAGGSGSYRLLVATDGSQAAGSALSGLRTLFEAAAVTLVCVEGSDSAGAPLPRLDSLRATLAAGGREVIVIRHPHVVGEPVATTLIRLVREQEADALAVATHGHGALRHVLLGSTALDVIARSPVPVVLVRWPLGGGAGQARTS
jgi:nucleotide-binding universal stress UspA family protein